MARLQGQLLGLVVTTLLLVALACAPGLQDALIARLPRGLLPSFLVWGLGDAVNLPKLFVTWVMAPIVVAVALAVVAGRGRPAPQRLLFCFLTATFVGWTAVCTSSGIGPALGGESVVALACIAASGMALALALDGTGAARLLALSAAPAVPVALYSLCQHLGIDPLGWDPRHAEPERTIATFGNPDFFATWMAAVVPIAAWRAGAASAPLARSAWGAVVGLLSVIVVFSYTRTAWLGLAVAAALMLTWCRPRWDLRAQVAFVVTAMSLTLLLTLRPTETFTLSGRLSETMRGDRSVSVRVVLWEEALQIVRHSPLMGAGLDTFSYAAMPYRAGEPSWLRGRVGLPGDPHNAWLEMAAACGAVGAALVLALACFAGASALAASRGTGEMATAARFTFVSGLVLCLEHFLIRMTVPSMWLAFMLAAVAVALRWPVSAAAVRPALSRLLILVGGVGAVLAAGTGWRVVDADLQANLAGMVVERALRVGGEEGAALLRDGLARYEQAAALAGGGIRAGRIASREARALETLLARIPPEEARAGQRDLAEAVGARALARAMFALEVNRLDPYLWHDLARVLGEVSQRAADPSREAALSSEAVAASRQGCELDPYNAALLADHARRLALSRQFEASDAAFRRALELQRAQPVRIDYARMLHQWGRDSEAVTLLREVVRQEPGNAVAVKLLQQIEGAPPAPDGATPGGSVRQATPQ